MRGLVFSVLLLLLLAPAVFAGDYDYRERLDIYTYRGAVHHTGPESPPDSEPNPCFPHGCGEILGPFTNPEPRTLEQMPICYYNQEGKLFYERPGHYCPYLYSDYADTNTLRVERRRQERRFGGKK